MTREDLAKDILLTILPRWLEAMEKEPAGAWKGPMRMVSQTSVELADALLEALGAKEAPASWLSKEMRTPAKGFPAIKGEGSWIPKVGDRVRLPHGIGPSNPKAVVGTVVGYVRDGVAIVSVETEKWGPKVYEFPAFNLELEPAV